MPLSINAPAFFHLLNLHKLAVNQFNKENYIANNAILLYLKTFYFVDLKPYFEAITVYDPELTISTRLMYKRVLANILEFGLALNVTSSQDQFKTQIMNHQYLIS